MNNITRVAVVGAGVAGLTVAWLLQKKYAVTLFEQQSEPGGHTHTVAVDTPYGQQWVDTGFMVYNQRNYPNLIQLFEWLGVDSYPTEMSFSVSQDGGHFEYAGSSLNTMFAQRRNVLSPRFWSFVVEVLKFNRVAKTSLRLGQDDETTIDEFLDEHRFSKRFRSGYLLPMGGAIWSCPTAQMRRFPARSLLNFFANHGLLDLLGRPQWRTLSGGSVSYVRRLLHTFRGQVFGNSRIASISRAGSGVRLVTENGTACEFDAVVIATHADQALRLLAEPTDREALLLGRFRYQTNRTLLHSDTRLMPRRRAAWSSWNY